MSKKVELFRQGLDRVLEYKRAQTEMTGWFRYQEIKMEQREAFRAAGCDPDRPENQARLLMECVRRMPLSIPYGSVIAGTQDDAFSPSYALINPSFKVETFAGYCDPVAVYNDLTPSAEFPAERIEKVRSYYAQTPYVRALNAVYAGTGAATREVVYFVEPVTGHVIPDLRPLLRAGVAGWSASASNATAYSATMNASAEAAVILALRYAELADQLAVERAGDADEVERLRLIAANCRQVPAAGARDLHQAVQAFALGWQVMCLEQAPNPYAFSVGNIDRILEPYAKTAEFDEIVVLVRHLLAFLMVGRRCWAISQNVLMGGSNAAGEDLTSPVTYACLQAFFESNFPQPALSVRLHRHTPPEFYRALEPFFFTAGHSTPSIFNDEAMFELLRKKGVAEADLVDYAIAGCQEPLIMGRENGNTTNSWLNLAKILELVLNDGQSLLTGEQLGPTWRELGYADADAAYADLENAFFKMLDCQLPAMAKAANACTEALAICAAPFSSLVMGCLETGRDLRDAAHPGTRYNGSGCLIHGLTVVVNSLIAVDAYRRAQIGSVADLRTALQNNFAGCDRLKLFLNRQDKFGNQLAAVDAVAARVAKLVSERVAALRNAGGFPFMPDFSTPSTHLLYGYWVGATPDGRESRAMLNYGVDPLAGTAQHGLPGRLLSNAVLPFGDFTGGYASHYGLDPSWFGSSAQPGEKMRRMCDSVIDPLFGFGAGRDAKKSPFYAYFNIDSAGQLRKVLAKPEQYAPNGIYIIRIHGTFVNFLDLSPAIQQDIIQRLDPESNAI